MLPLLIASAAVAAGSAIAGGIKSAKASGRMRKQLAKTEAENNAWYNKEYYQDYMNRSDAQATMKRVRDFMQRRGQQAQATAAITGATPESVAARRAADNQVISDTAAGIQANADAYKDSVRQQYLNQKQGILAGHTAQHQADAAAGGQMMSGGFSLAGSTLDAGFEHLGKK